MATICTYSRAVQEYNAVVLNPDPGTLPELIQRSESQTRQLLQGFKDCPVDSFEKRRLISRTSHFVTDEVGHWIDKHNLWRTNGAEAYTRHEDKINCYRAEAIGDLDLAPPSNYFSNLFYFKSPYRRMNVIGGMAALVCGYVAAMIQLDAPVTQTFNAVAVGRGLGGDKIVEAWNQLCHRRAVGWSVGIFVLVLGVWNLGTYLDRRNDSLSVGEGC